MSTDEPTKVCCDSIDLRIENGWLTEVHNHCTCGGSGIPSPAHLPGCGLVPLVPLADIIGMAEHDRQVAEQAWDEAVNASVLHYEPPSGLYSGVSWPANPYRADSAAPARPTTDDREAWKAVAERLIADERRRQVEVEGWTPEHDREHGHENIVKAGNAYLRNDQRLWPWLGHYWKPKSEVRNLIRAGALALAALDLAPASPGALGLRDAVVEELTDRLGEFAALAARPAPTVNAADVERDESLRELATGEWTIRKSTVADEGRAEA